MKRITPFLLALVYCALILVSFASILVQPGIIGHTWDWAMPNFPEQYRDHLIQQVFSWHSGFETGRYHYFKLELLYWLLLMPFTLFGGAFMSKFVPMILLLLCGLSMYWLARKHFKLNPFFAFLSGLLFMFSPYSYSRIVAGHLPALFGYSLLPIIVLCFFNILQSAISGARLPKRSIVLGGLLVGQTAIHPSIGLVAIVISMVIYLLGLITAKHKLHLTRGMAGVFLIALFLNAHWFVPFMEDRMSSGIIRHGWGFSAGSGEAVTINSEMPFREQFLRSTSQPLSNLLTLHMREGMDTEYVFPVPESLSLQFLSFAVSAILVILAYGFNFFVDKPQRRVLVLCLTCTGLAGLLLNAGVRSFPGLVFFGALKNTVPLVYEAMSNAARWFPLVVLSVAALAPLAMQNILDRFAEKRKVLAFGFVSLIIIAVSPFLTNRLSRPVAAQEHTTQPLSLKVTPIHPEDRAVYDFLSSDEDPYRVFYLPPPFVSWPGETQLSYEWSSTFSPKSAFPVSMGTPFGKAILENLYSNAPSPTLARLLGMASVKYVLYPKYDNHFSYVDFLPEFHSKTVFDHLKDYKPVLDRNLIKVEGLRPDIVLPTVTIYKNDFYVPRIYLPDNIEFLNTSLEHIISFIDDVKGDRPLIILPHQMNADLKSELLDANIMTHDIKAGAKMSFKRISPVRYEITIQNISKPFPLVLNESYDPEWRLYEVSSGLDGDCGRGLLLEKYSSLVFHASNAKCLREITRHFVSNGYGNAWLVIPGQGELSQGPLRFVVEFGKQRMYELGLIVYAITLLVCLVYLIMTSGRVKLVSAINGSLPPRAGGDNG